VDADGLFCSRAQRQKTWRTTDGTWIAEKVQTLFFKKAPAIVYQDFKDDFCVLFFFVSDDFTRDVVREVSAQLSGRQDGEALGNAAILVNGDVTFCGFEDLSHCSRAFKEKFGVSPANYRKQI
jgi:hypothetical protein